MGGNNTLGSVGSINYTNTWHYIVVTIDSSYNATLYVDGAYNAGPRAYGSPSSKTGDLNYGRYGGGGYVLNGALDEVRLSNTVRPANRITAEWNNQKTGSTFVVVGNEI